MHEPDGPATGTDTPAGDPGPDTTGSPAAVDSFEADPVEGTGRGELSRSRSMLFLAAVAAMLVSWGLGQDSGYLLVVPGPAPEITELVSGDVRDPEFGDHGDMRITTVEASTLTWAQWLHEHVRGGAHRSVIPETQLGSSPEIARRNAIVDMRDSKRIAAHLARAVVDGDGTVQATGALVIEVVSSSPAEQAGIVDGDVIVDIDGAGIKGSTAVADYIAAGTGPVNVHIERAGEPRTVSVDPGAGDSRALGVRVVNQFPGEDTLDELTGDLDIDVQGIGGPSGGLMFTIALIDALSPGDLTGSKDLAGTGTIDTIGNVGPISGAGDKVVGAHAEGSDVFFSPTLNADEASASAPEGIEVVPVATYVDALVWLCDNGATDTVCDKLDGDLTTGR